jgi:spore coat-associated protein N
MTPRRNITRGAALKVTLFCALAAVAALAIQPRATTPPDAGLVLVDGTFSQSNSRDGSAILSASGMRPGQVVQGTVTIANTGDLGGEFRLAKSNLVDEPGPGGGALSGRLDLLVEDVTGAPATVYAGKLGAMGERPLGTWASGESRTYRFTVSLPEDVGDNAYAGSRTSVQYDWHAESDGTGGGNGNGGGGSGGGNGGGGGGNGGGSGGNGGANGGGGAGSEAPPSPQSDTTAPQLILGGPAKQKLTRRRNVVVLVQCDESCSVTAAATLAGVRRARKFRIPAVTAQAGANSPLKLTLKLPARAAKALKKALRTPKGRKKAAVTATVIASDAAGNAAASSRRIRLRK